MTPYLIYYQILAYTGMILLMLAPLPQIKKTINAKNTENLSGLMWLMLLIGALCLLILTVLTSDTMPAIFLTVFLIETLVMMYLYFQYRGKKPLTALSPRDKAQKKEALTNIEHLLFSGKNRVHLLNSIEFDEEKKEIAIAVSPADQLPDITHFIFHNASEFQEENLHNEKPEFPQEIIGIESKTLENDQNLFTFQCQGLTYSFKASYPIKK